MISPPKFGFLLMLRSVRIGICRVGRVDGDAAAVGVLEADDVVDVRIARQQLGLDPLDRVLDDAGDALHGRRDGEDVARADRAVGVAEALEGVALERRRRRRRDASRSAGPRASAPRASSAAARGPSCRRRSARRRSRSRCRSEAPARRRRSRASATLCPCGTRSFSTSPAAKPPANAAPASRPPSLATMATLSRSSMRIVCGGARPRVGVCGNGGGVRHGPKSMLAPRPAQPDPIPETT